MIPHTFFWLVAVFVMVCKAHHFDDTRDNKGISRRNESGVYRLTDSYNSTNFFDKFNFHVVRVTSSSTVSSFQC